LQAEIGVTRDSVNLILSASTEKDSIIHEKDQIIVSQSKIISLKDQVITTQEKENSDLKKNIKHYKKQRNIAYVGSGGLFILSLLLLL
jgi:cell division protein FtsL